MLDKLKDFLTGIVMAPQLAREGTQQLLEAINYERRARKAAESEVQELRSQLDGPFRTIVELRGKIREDHGVVQSYRDFSIGKEVWLRRGERRRETFRIETSLCNPVVAVVQGPGLIALAAVRGNVWARSDTCGSGGVLCVSLGKAPLEPAWGVDVDIISSMPPEGV